MEKQEDTGKRLIDEEQDDFDAIIVGSGYGGSVASFRLAMAGIKVCLVEKGRQWESHDFATDSLEIMSTVRMENQNLRFSFGPKDALFQVLSLSVLQYYGCFSKTCTSTDRLGSNS